jgi:mannosyltransferase
VALIALAAVMRFATLDAKGLWEDEANVAFLIRMDPLSMLGALVHTERTPPLFFLLAFGWAKLFGSGEVGMRSLSALIGLAVVPVGYLIGREFVSSRTGLVTAALIAVNPLLVWYSQEARAYSLLVLTSALALLFFGRALRGNRPRDLVLWTLTACLSLVTHYFAVFLVVPEMLWLLYRLGPRRPVLAAAGTAIAVGVALLPLALTQRASFRADWITQIGLGSRVVQVPGIFLVGFESPAPLLTAGVAALLAGYGIWLLLRRADEAARRRGLLVGAIGAVAVLLPLAMALVGVDHFIYKNVSGAVVPLTVAVGIGFAAPRAGRLGVAAAVGLAALSGAVVIATAWEPKYHREAWREAAQALGPATGARAVIATPGDAGKSPLEYYLPQSRVLRAGGAWVSEIDVLALRRRPLGAIATPRLPRLSAVPGPPAPGYRLVERRDAEYFKLLRYRASRPQYARIGALEAAAVDRVDAVVFVQTPRARAARVGLPDQSRSPG